MSAADPSARQDILAKVRLAVAAQSQAAPAVPESARVAPRPLPANGQALGQFIDEVRKLGVKDRQVGPGEPLRRAVQELVQSAGVRKAALWDTPELKALGMAEALQSCGVEIVPPDAPYRLLAQCDLGVTTAEAALPETGTLVLASSAQMPRAVSLLPRIHLAVIRPGILVADLRDAFARMKGQGYFVFVTGPSRTSDIELTLTIGVHGPKELHIWMVGE